MKSGLAKDAVWFLLVLFAFGAGWAIRSGGREHNAPLASEPQRNVRGVTAMPDSSPKWTPPSKTPPGGGSPQIGASAGDPMFAEIERRAEGLAMIEKLASLAKGDPKTAQDIAYYLSSNFDPREVPVEHLKKVFNQFRRTDAAGALAWLESLPEEVALGTSTNMVSHVHEWAGQDPRSALAWVEMQQEAPNYDHLAAAYVARAHEFDPESAAKVAATISDETLRKNAECLAEGGVMMAFSISETSVRIRAEY